MHWWETALYIVGIYFCLFFLWAWITDKMRDWYDRD